MENDASSAGVRLGGLFSTAEIKILVCYILTTIKEPVPATMLANVLHYEGIANVFEVSDAIVSLQKSGHIKPVDEKEEMYVITEKGIAISDELKTSLSFTVKNRAYSAAIKMLSRFKNARDSEFSVSKENGATYVTCTATDGRMPFMSIKLLVADDTQASIVKERFIDDPAGLYHAIVDFITKKEEK